MEIGINADIPTYSGGLGILAGDTIETAADMTIPMVGITLLHRKGYILQQLDSGIPFSSFLLLSFSFS